MVDWTPIFMWVFGFVFGIITGHYLTRVYLEKKLKRERLNENLELYASCGQHTILRHVKGRDERGRFI